MLTTILALVVSAAIDSTTLFIGDQTDLHLRATSEVGEQVQMPVLGEHLIPGIEIVDRTIVDTTTLGWWYLRWYGPQSQCQESGVRRAQASAPALLPRW